MQRESVLIIATIARSALLPLLLAIGLATGATAQGAATWLPVRTGDTEDSQHFITGDTDPVYAKDGTLVVITVVHDSGQAHNDFTAFVRRPGGNFTKQTLDPAQVFQWDTAVDPRGGMDLVWRAGNGCHLRVVS